MDQTGIQEFIPHLQHLFPLDRYKAMQYFEHSTFFQVAGRDANGNVIPVNNTEARLRGLDPVLPSVLESMPHGRPEFVLESCQEPHTFVIRKQVRGPNPIEQPSVIAYYFIINNKIMQAPSLHQVTHARLRRLTYGLQHAFARLQQDLEPLTRTNRRQEALMHQHQQQEGQRQHAAAAAPATTAAAAAPQAPPADAAAPPAAPGPSPFTPYVDLASPSLGTLRAPLASPLPEVLAAMAEGGGGRGAGGAGGRAPVRRHHTDKERERWSKIDRILANQFGSLQHIKYSALPKEYHDRLRAGQAGQQQQQAALPTPAVPAEQQQKQPQATPAR